MIITISGKPGAGKNTVAEMLAKNFHYKHYSMGDLIGEMANKKGMTANELVNQPLCQIDKEVDNYQKELAENEDSFIIDGRISFYFIPSSVKIYLDVDLAEGARRIFNNQRKDEKKYKDLEDVIHSNKQRVEDEIKRYKAYDNIDCHATKNYDLVIDTTDIKPQEVTKKIMDFIMKSRNFYSPV